MSDKLAPCPFCGKPFVLKQVGAETSFEHDAPGCPLEEHGLQIIELSIDTMTEMLNTRAEEKRLLTIATDYEDVLNAILQPGILWLDYLREYRAAGEYGAEWYGENGPRLELAQQRLIEALRDAAKKMPPQGK